MYFNDDNAWCSDGYELLQMLNYLLVTVGSDTMVGGYSLASNQLCLFLCFPYRSTINECIITQRSTIYERRLFDTHSISQASVVVHGI